MIILNVQQGSDEWLKVRAKYHTASESPSMMGVSKHTKRNELLHMKSTGSEREFSDWVQKNILNKGHEVEFLARHMAEKIIGEDLFPITVADDDGYLLASLDGMTMSGETIFEHKQFNAELFAAVKAGECPEYHLWQIIQGMKITKAKRCLFMVSNGTAECCAWTYVHRNTWMEERLFMGWKQFDDDLANYKPIEAIPIPMASPQMALPSVFIQVNGSIALIDNLAAFGDALKAYIDGINKKPETDQDFADLETTVKTLKTAEESLDASENNALAQTESIDAMRRTVAMYRTMARDHRLMAEKLVKFEKENRRAQIMQEGKDRLAKHIEMLNKRIGNPYMQTIIADFSGAMKGKKTIASLQDSVDTELARAKIEANAIADSIEINLNTLRDMAKDHTFLFSDAAQLVVKMNDDLISIIKTRISEYSDAEYKKGAFNERIWEENLDNKQDGYSESIEPESAPAHITQRIRPNRSRIIDVVASSFGVDAIMANDWLCSEFTGCAIKRQNETAFHPAEDRVFRGVRERHEGHGIPVLRQPME